MKIFPKLQLILRLFQTFSLIRFTEMEVAVNTKNSYDTAAKAVAMDFLTKKAYTPPPWASHIDSIPSHTVSLGQFPTPIHKWNLPNLPPNTGVWLKRDDLSGMQVGGNKIRKLEFLIADAVAKGADCVITIGGIQSNHCCATAVAAKYLNLDSYLMLATPEALLDKNPGVTGNLLIDHLVGAHVVLIAKEDWIKFGQEAVTNPLKEKLLKEGRRPYVIPAGGSNALGTWGYIEAIREIEQQLQSLPGKFKFDAIVAACGSGGTIAGLSLGSWLSSLKAKVHAFAVASNADNFYNFVQGIFNGAGAGVDSRDILDVQDAKGLGYAITTPEELNFVKEIAATTGVVLDPVYTGKAAYGMMKDMAENPKKWEGRKILFIHSGGLLGLYDKVEQMAPLLGNWRRMDVNESVPRGVDDIGKMF
ncbi:hypothetical protein TB2_039479 [Malus domestica]